MAAPRAKSAGWRLHMRLTRVFALFALIPTVLVAVFAALTVGIGLEGWFSDRVRSVVGSSLAAAEAYETEHREDLIEDARALARLPITVELTLPFCAVGGVVVRVVVVASVEGEGRLPEEREEIADLLVGEVGIARGQVVPGTGGADADQRAAGVGAPLLLARGMRSEERRVGKECRSRGSPYH